MLFLAPASLLPGQLSVQLRLRFVDSVSGGSGSTGVARDGVAGNFYVLDSSNARSVHEFGPQGALLSQFGTSGCNPAAPNPFGITYDPTSDSLWVLDGNLTGPGITSRVVEVGRGGACRSGFSFVPASTRPGGITYHPHSDTLWIAGYGQVSQWDKQGNRLRGGFSFTTPFGNRRLSGIACLSRSNRFAVVANGDRLVYELDSSGSVVSILDLSSFGVTDTQGAHFDAPTRTLSVVDGAQSAVYVFEVCTGTVTRYGMGCLGPTGARLRLELAGCPMPGNVLSFSLTVGAANTLPVWFVAGAGNSTLQGGTPLPLSLAALGAPGCELLVAPDATAGPLGNPGGGATLLLPIPNSPGLQGLELHWQSFQIGPGIPTPLPLVTSDALTVRIG